MPDSKSKKKAQGKHTILSLNKRVSELEETVERLVKGMGVGSINKPEKQISENEFPTPAEKKMKMGEDMKIQSMRNAIAILPPNLKDDEGKHSMLNISRICGFKVSLEMYDKAYEGLKV